MTELPLVSRSLFVVRCMPKSPSPSRKVQDQRPKIKVRPTFSLFHFFTFSLLPFSFLLFTFDLINPVPAAERGQTPRSPYPGWSLSRANRRAGPFARACLSDRA